MPVPPTTVSAHGAQLGFCAEALLIQHSFLAQSLGQPREETVPWSEIDQVELESTPAACFDVVHLHTASGRRRLRFAPGTAAQTAQRLLEAGMAGEIAKPANGDEAATTAEALAGLDFTAVDVETANDDWGSICAIGAVRYRDGQEVASRSWLCTPPPGMEEFAAVNVSIHGITSQQLADAPSCAQALQELLGFLGEDVLVAHNVQFDATALQRAAQACEVELPEISLACSLALARDASRAGVLSVDNHRLPTVHAALGGPEFTHHDATADARAAGFIITGLAQVWARQQDSAVAQLWAEKQDAGKAAGEGGIGKIAQLCAAREFTLGTLRTGEVMPVLRAATAPTAPEDLGAGTDFRDSTRNAGRGENGRSGRRSPAPWAAVSTPDAVPEPDSSADPDNPLFGQHVTLTGEFSPYDKGMLWERLAAAGAQVGKSVTKKTTVLVLGSWATQTSKEKRAHELIAKGQDIALWPQEQLLEALGLDIQPPF
ncbi:DNA polymerase III subunit epsilon [Corynebacterium lizhenjunii]|uniref:DNA polymerase III subunit epsilon n=1 Tax=Corynebacterium lizhenjunii TaxID=2709394 RepID=A0A7T0PB85_9CORY|nr:exonuclease domain-containing protein [Corynebacterium lizhenjunii]QPK78477.1 DNA polymerase III subunit epsilon [Corynebacterium lizhenjunii]